MRQLGELEIGVMFWAGADPVETLREVKSLGVRCGQLGVPGDMALESAVEPWKSALEQEQFTLVTIFCSYAGESYADLPTVQNTVGFVPQATRVQREQRTKDVSHFAAALGVESIACHVGFVPENIQGSVPGAIEDPEYIAVRDVVRRICDHAAHHHQTFALETGQERADVLLRFIADVDRPNVRINFDPANLIMYGTGDPIQALGLLGQHVVSVHAKDGSWPAKHGTSTLGVEMPLGHGALGLEQFIAKLKQVGYTGTIHVEREGAAGPEQRLADIRAAVELLKRVRDAA